MMTRRKATNKKKAKRKFKPGDRVKINTGGKYIASVDDCFGTVRAGATRVDQVLVDVDGESRLPISISRLSLAE